MKIKKILLVILFPLFCIACGDSDHDWEDEGEQQIKEVYVTKKEIEVGEDTRVDVYFETKREEVWGEPKDIQVVVKLPYSLTYKEESSKLHVGDLWRKSREPDYVKVCNDNTTFLFYDLDDNDDFDDIWVSRYDISFHVTGIERSELAVIFAQAKSYIDFSCSTEFASQMQGSLTIK